MKTRSERLFFPDQSLPDPFRDLEPYLAWALVSERDREVRRLESNIEELRALYEAITPRIESIVDYLNHFALNEMPSNAAGFYIWHFRGRRSQAQWKFTSSQRSSTVSIHGD